MHLTPTEQGRLLLYTATLLARERHQRGVKLNVPEATALISHAACEAARDGGRLEDAVAAGRAALTADDVLPEVPGILTEIQVEAVFADGSKLIVITDPLGPAPDPTTAPGAVLPADHSEPEYADLVRIEVTNTADVPVTVTSHFHFFEANRALAFDRASAYGRHLALPVGSSARFDPGTTEEVELTPIGGDRIVIGFAGLVDGPLDAPGTFEAALTRAHVAGYLDTGPTTDPEGDL
ncbi:urease subunit gamma [Streptomyces acidiscabies]|uniref:urease n=1 Tax=Streptomyces acidiscabies TaxID=42234 RepID=A0ABU4MDB8_9ACTN|nr:urease subunit gamma [Streptomyces acidiscabies]MDX3025802.1 urease subunit gamma [Streptomyces acidiscabies]